MLGRQFDSQRTLHIRSRRDLFKQNFYVHHPLLEQIIEAKLEKCLNTDNSERRIISRTNIAELKEYM
jgi:hypothetical protein